MSQRPFWASIIQWTLWGLAMAGIASWLGSGRKTRNVPGEQVVMKYPRAALVMAAICVVLFGGVAVLSMFASAEKAPWWTTAIFGVFLLLSLHWLAECRVARYRLTGDGFEYVSVFSGKHFFQWDELHNVKYAPNMRWFFVRDSQGHVARISVMMTDLPEFARLLMERARKVYIDPEAVNILKRTASGEPPAVWP